MATSTSSAAFSKAMHGKSAGGSTPFLSMLSKDNEAHRIVTNEYLGRWQDDSKTNVEEAREARKAEYMGLVNK